MNNRARRCRRFAQFARLVAGPGVVLHAGLFEDALHGSPVGHELANDESAKTIGELGPNRSGVRGFMSAPLCLASHSNLAAADEGVGQALSHACVGARLFVSVKDQGGRRWHRFLLLASDHAHVGVLAVRALPQAAAHV